MTTVASNAISALRNWWWFIIKGIFFIIAGAAVLSKPVEGYAGLSILFSICILGIGISQIVFSVGNRDVFPGWGWTLVSGIIDVVAGSYLLMYPAVTMATLPFFVGFWLMFRAFYIMGASIDLQNYRVPGWGWVLAGGFLLLLCSGFILYYPAAAAVAIVAWSGAAFLIGGVLAIVMGFKLRSVGNVVKKLV